MRRGGGWGGKEKTATLALLGGVWRIKRSDRGGGVGGVTCGVKGAQQSMLGDGFRRAELRVEKKLSARANLAHSS